MGKGDRAVDEVGNHLVLVVDLVVDTVQLPLYQPLDVALTLRHHCNLPVDIR